MLLNSFTCSICCVLSITYTVFWVQNYMY
jgi:hypothetical protein